MPKIISALQMINNRDDLKNKNNEINFLLVELIKRILSIKYYRILLTYLNQNQYENRSIRNRTRWEYHRFQIN